MRSFLFFSLLLLSVSPSFAQVYATTDDGQRVLLKADSTWQYLTTTDSAIATEDTRSAQTYTKPVSATILKASTRNKFGVWIDNKKWKISGQILSPLAEFSFQNTGKFEEAFCMAITERVQASMPQLKKQVILNSRTNVENYKLVKQEYLTVNNHKVLHLVFKGTVQGMQVEYSGYYSTDASGVIQVVCFTTENLFAGYEKDFTDLLNGLVVLK